MQTTATAVRLTFDEKNRPELTLTLSMGRSDALSKVHKLKEHTTSDKKLAVDIKPHRNRRSLNANAYMWVLLEKLAQALNTDKDSLYIEMLDRYGVFTHLIVKPEAADRVKAGWRTVRELGEVTINGRTGIQLQCYFGSSTYNTAEMARLIDGVVSECAEVGIETLPPAEIEALKNLWEGSK